MRKSWVVSLMAGCAIGAGGAGAAAVGHAQQPQVVTSRGAQMDDDHLSEKARRLLARPVTIRLVDVSQRRAIDLVAEKAGVHVSYRGELVDGTRNTVTLDVKNIALSDVFERILEGTALRLTVLPGDQLAVVALRGEQAQAAGTILGQLRDATGSAIGNAHVVLRGTSMVTTSKEDGTFRFTNVPLGAYVVTATRLGYQQAEAKVNVALNDSTFQLRPVAVTLVMKRVSTRLTDVVTTATGSQERLKVGNDVGTINADSLVRNTLVRNVSDLLTGNTPGVQTTPTGGAVGAPSKIRIRGVASPQLNNDPIVVVDGVRINAQTTVNSVSYSKGKLPISQVNTGSPTIGSSGQLAPSPLDQIDPNLIESIDVLKGPTATALYGPDASTGVIVIKTKRGQAGPWRYHVGGDYGWTLPITSGYPLQYTGWGHSPATGLTQPGCRLLPTSPTSGSQVDGGCVIDSVTGFNPQNHAEMTNLATATNQTIVADASGGGSTVQGFVQGSYANSLGQTKLSEVEQRRIARLLTTPVPSWMIRPNAQQNAHVSTKMQMTFSPAFDVAVTGQGIYQLTRNDGTGLMATAIAARSLADTLSHTPAEFLRTRSTTSSKRGIGGVNARLQPFSWIVFTGTGGLDYGMRDDQGLSRAQECSAALFFCTSRHSASRTEVMVPSFTAGATVTYSLAPWLTARTVVGEQYSRTQSYQLGVDAADLSFGSEVITGASSISVPTESTDESASAGWYAEQQFAVNDRLFLTAALRRDASSAFGRNSGTPTFPKYGASWVVSNEPFFPRQSVVTQFRLRTAYGESGKQGAQGDVLRNFTYATGYVGTATVPVLIMSSIGNSTLQPQRDREWEGGFDMSLYGDRATITGTLYRKASHNAIISVNLPPSPGAPIPIRAANVGDIQNNGYELQLSLRPLDTRLVTWDFSMTASSNSNKLLNKNDLVDLPNFSGGRIVPGYPMFGLWERPVLSYGDYNGNKILEDNEIVFGDSAVFVGSTDPKGSFNYSNSLTLMGGRLRLNSLVSQVNGLATTLTVQNPRDLVDKTASLAEQAAALQAFGTPSVRGAGGFMGVVSYVNFATLSASYTIPERLAQRFRSRSAVLTVAARNLALWTNYRGADPTTNTASGGGDGAGDDGTGLAQPRSWVLRLSFMF